MSQSYEQQSEQVMDEKEMSTTEQPAASSTAVSNQAQLEDAGLDRESEQDGDTLDGPFAGLILDAMSLSSALDSARDHVSNPAVLDWVRSLDLDDVRSLGTQAEAFIGSLWPVGYGFETSGILGFGNATGEGTMAVVRTAPDTIQVQRVLAGELGLDVGPPGAGLQGAFGDTLAAATLSMGVHFFANMNLETDLSFSWTGWAEKMDVDWSASLLESVMGNTSPVLGPPSIVEALQEAHLSVECEDRLTEVHLSAAGEAGGALMTGDPVQQLSWFGVDLERLFEEVPGLDVVMGMVEPMLQFAAGVDVGLLSMDGQMVVECRGTLSLLGQLMRSVPILGPLLSPELEKVMESPAGMEVAGTVRVPVGTSPMAVEVSGATFEVSQSLHSGDGCVQTGVAVPLREAAGLFQGCDGQDFDHMLGTTLNATMYRDVTVPLGFDRLKQVFPALLSRMEANVTDQGFLAMDGEVSLQARAVFEGGALAGLSGRSLEVPDWFEERDLQMQLADGVFAARFGGSVPDWLAGHQDVLGAAAGLVRFETARVVGRIRGGAGGGVSGQLGPEVDVNASANLAITVDQPVEASDMPCIEAAMA